MTAIGSILKSYLIPGRYVFWLLVMGALCVVPCLLIMQLATHGTEEISFSVSPSYFYFPLFGFCFGIAAVGVHLRQMLFEGEESDMLPYFNKRQLTASGIIAISNLLVYLAATLLFGWLPLPALAGFLCVTAITLWFGQFALGVLFFFSFILVVVRDFPGGIISNILFETQHAAWTGAGAHGNILSVLLIILAFGGIIFFCVRYLTITCATAVNHRFFLTLSGSMGMLPPDQRARLAGIFADKNKDSRTYRSIKKAVSRMAANRPGQPHSVFQLTQLIRFAMFGVQEGDRRNRNWRSNKIRMYSAGYGVLAVIYGATLGVLFRDKSFAIVFGMTVLFGTIVTMIAFTFQSNKNQLPMLYLQAGLPSKSAFLKAAAAGYLLTAAEHFLICTCAALTTHFFFPSLAWPRMFQIVINNAAMVLVYASVLLLTGNQRKTPPGQGWMMKFLFLYFPFVFFSGLASSWVATGVCFLACALFFYKALRSWTKSEMDCE